MINHVQVLSLFDRSGVMVKPWEDAGYSTLTVDVAKARHNGPSLVADIATLDTPICDVLFAFPPCTHLASSGARWWQGKGPEALEEAMLLVNAAILASTKAQYWMIENPIGRLSTVWRKPDWKFDPCDYAIYADNPALEAYTKRTCIWGNIPMPPKVAIPAIHGSKLHRLSPSPDRAYLRSITPSGFAYAMFKELT